MSKRTGSTETPPPVDTPPVAVNVEIHTSEPANGRPDTPEQHSGGKTPEYRTSEDGDSADDAEDPESDGSVEKEGDDDVEEDPPSPTTPPRLQYVEQSGPITPDMVPKMSPRGEEQRDKALQALASLDPRVIQALTNVIQLCNSSVSTTQTNSLVLQLQSQQSTLTGAQLHTQQAVTRMETLLSKVSNDLTNLKEDTDKGIAKLEELVKSVWSSVRHSRGGVTDNNDVCQSILKELESFKAEVRGSVGAPDSQAALKHKPVKPTAPPQPEEVCRFCSGPHPLMKCTDFPTWESRRQLMIQQQACFQCLLSGVCQGGKPHEGCPKGSFLCQKCAILHNHESVHYRRMHHHSLCERNKPQDLGPPPFKKAKMHPSKKEVAKHPRRK